MLKHQNNVCAICNRPETLQKFEHIQSLSVDHDHKTGIVRGLLCAKCNYAIGNLSDSVNLLKSAIHYLENKMKIIGIGHRKNTGKNTLAKFMITYLRCNYPGLRVKEVSFAAKLKDICHQLFGWAGLEPGIFYESHRDVKETILPALDMSPRDIWVEVGNKLREIYSDTWINAALRGVEGDILIFPDLRFRNEAKAIHEIGGTSIKLIRDSVKKGTDPAEVDLDNWKLWDVIVNNNGTLNELNTEAEKLIKELL